MKLKRILAIILRFGFLLRRNKTRFINILGWSILDILVWGFTTLYLDSINKLNFSFVSVILGAAVLWLLMIRVHQGFLLPFLEDVWSKNFINLFASPLKISEYAAGLALSALMTAAFAFVVILLVASLFFGYNIFQLGFILIPFLIILFIFGLALGIFTAGLVLRLGPPAEWLAWIIPFVLAPLSSVYYPVSALPGIIQPVAKIFPATYVFESMRSILLFGSFPLQNLIISFFLSLFYLVIAYWFFIYIYKSVLRNGLLARFSAESV